MILLIDKNAAHILLCIWKYIKGADFLPGFIMDYEVRGIGCKFQHACYNCVFMKAALS